MAAHDDDTLPIWSTYQWQWMPFPMKLDQFKVTLDVFLDYLALSRLRWTISWIAWLKVLILQFVLNLNGSSWQYLHIIFTKHQINQVMFWFFQIFSPNINQLIWEDSKNVSKNSCRELSSKRGSLPCII